MARKGYVKSWRDKLDDERLVGDLIAYAIHDMLYKRANTAPSDVMYGRDRVKVLRGQCYFSAEKLHETTKTPQSTIKDKLKLLEEWGYLETVRAGRHGRIVTLVGWVEEQARIAKRKPVLGEPVDKKSYPQPICPETRATITPGEKSGDTSGEKSGDTPPAGSPDASGFDPLPKKYPGEMSGDTSGEMSGDSSGAY